MSAEEEGEKVERRPQYGPVESVEGWVLFVTNVHEEAREDDVVQHFETFGKVVQVKMNYDRKTGLGKGYALVEYAKKAEGQDAINNLHSTEFLGKKIGVSWAFVKQTGQGGGSRRS